MTDAPMPSYNPASQGPQAAAGPVQPKQIRWSYLLILTAALLQVVAAVFTLMYQTSPAFKASVEATLATQNVPASVQNPVDFAVSTALGFTLGGTILGVISYVVLGLFIKKGAGWARMIAAILTVISLGEVKTLMLPGSIFTILQIAAGVAAMLLCFIKPGSAYFVAMKNHRAALKAFAR